MEQSYKILNCREFGDYVISERTFEEGETVFKEETLLSFPVHDHRITEEPDVCCVGCYKVITFNSMSCPKCDFPVCSDVCSQNKFHKNLECSIFAENKIEPSQYTFRCVKYLRVLLSIKVYPKLYKKFKLLSTEFDSEIGEISLSADEESQRIWDFLTEECHLKVTLFEVKQICLALKINSFYLFEEENSGTRYRGNAVFTLCSKLSHSCNPNLDGNFLKMEAEDGTVRWYLHFYAKKNIAKGEVLSISYSPRGLNYGTGYRRVRYQNSLPFRCLCPRCLSPTEEGTHFSSVKCSKCKWGYLLPEEPLSSLTCTWECSHCTYSKDGEDVDLTISEYENVVSIFMNGEPASLDSLDRFIDENSGITLHPNHFVVFQATVYWLLNSDWTAKLIMQDGESLYLYEKILTRFNRCLPLVQKFLRTKTIVDLEAAVAAAIAAFTLKSDDFVNINVIVVDIKVKFWFYKMIASHLSRANFWVERQLRYEGCEDRKEYLAALFDRWSLRLEICLEDLLQQETEMEDVALSSIRFLFG